MSKGAREPWSRYIPRDEFQRRINGLLGSAELRNSIRNIINEGQGIIEVTHAELISLKNNASLIPSRVYLITDFQTIHYVPGTNGTGTYGTFAEYANDDIHEGAIEPLFVTATTTSTISSVAISQFSPGDTISYMLDASAFNTLLGTLSLPSLMCSAPTSKGVITYRKCSLSNCSGYFDIKSVVHTDTWGASAGGYTKKWCFGQKGTDVTTGAQVTAYAANALHSPLNSGSLEVEVGPMPFGGQLFYSGYGAKHNLPIFYANSYFKFTKLSGVTTRLVVEDMRKMNINIYAYNITIGTGAYGYDIDGGANLTFGNSINTVKIKGANNWTFDNGSYNIDIGNQCGNVTDTCTVGENCFGLTVGQGAFSQSGIGSKLTLGDNTKSTKIGDGNSNLILTINDGSEYTRVGNYNTGTMTITGDSNRVGDGNSGTSSIVGDGLIIGNDSATIVLNTCARVVLKDKVIGFTLNNVSDSEIGSYCGRTGVTQTIDEASNVRIGNRCFNSGGTLQMGSNGTYDVTIEGLCYENVTLAAGTKHCYIGSNITGPVLIGGSDNEYIHIADFSAAFTAYGNNNERLSTGPKAGAVTIGTFGVTTSSGWIHVGSSSAATIGAGSVHINIGDKITGTVLIAAGSYNVKINSQAYKADVSTQGVWANVTVGSLSGFYSRGTWTDINIGTNSYLNTFPDTNNVTVNNSADFIASSNNLSSIANVVVGDNNILTVTSGASQPLRDVVILPSTFTTGTNGVDINNAANVNFIDTITATISFDNTDYYGSRIESGALAIDTLVIT